MLEAIQGKKLILVPTSSASVTEASKKAYEVILNWVPCIYYPVQFQKNKGATIQALINLNSKVNTITPAYAK